MRLASLLPPTASVPPKSRIPRGILVNPQNSMDTRTSDDSMIELLRAGDGLSIGDMAAALGVTATAVRQRLDRLMRAGFVERRPRVGRRGRPAHAYTLTDSGRKLGGDNFRDLALVLWRELRTIQDADVRRGLLGRIGRSLASLQAERVRGSAPGERLRGVAELLHERNIACTVTEESPAASGSSLTVLTSYTCPYPDLAEEDRGICAAERLMIEELVGSPVRLSECRLDGGTCCRFTASGGGAVDDGSMMVQDR
jgi:DeoR family suf operon transcriptional repressor